MGVGGGPGYAPARHGVLQRTRSPSARPCFPRAANRKQSAWRAGGNRAPTRTQQQKTYAGAVVGKELHRLSRRGGKLHTRTEFCCQHQLALTPLPPRAPPGRAPLATLPCPASERHDAAGPRASAALQSCPEQPAAACSSPASARRGARNARPLRPAWKGWRGSRKPAQAPARFPLLREAAHARRAGQQARMVGGSGGQERRRHAPAL